MKQQKRYLFAAVLLLVCIVSRSQSFVKRDQHGFLLQGKPYFFIGANYWYGGLLGNSDAGKKRIKQELDFLKKKGVVNLRVLAGAEGSGKIHGITRVGPSFQPGKEIFNQDLLKGLDFLLSEMGKRNMKAVIFLSNNWEWSGGFLQYLNWNGLIPDSILRRKLSWDEMRDYVSLFYNCADCKKDYYNQVKVIVNRKNTVTGIPYSKDPAIMSWELANEPRPMRPTADAEFLKWVSEAAAYIKSIDGNHLVTTGCEGIMGTESMDVFKSMHADKNIDYATIHIWPKNWGWFQDTDVAGGLNKVISNTDNYISEHSKAAREFGKPLVLEEFGLPRDQQSFSLNSTTSSRDKYYADIFGALLSSYMKQDVIAGANFWSFSGAGRPSGKNGIWWQQGDDWLGDPPMEEQGLNSVFDADESTWKIITSFTQKINKQNAVAP